MRHRDGIPHAPSIPVVDVTLSATTRGHDDSHSQPINEEIMATADEAGDPFRLALSLTGGASTGTYCAGALDFIIEALDAFEQARTKGADQAPPHRVLLEGISGASSGALTGAIAASGLRFAFDPVHPDDPDHPDRDLVTRLHNPLYNSWVNLTDAAHLLGVQDADEDGIPSLFDCTQLNQVAQKTITFGAGHALKTREWLAEPLRVCFSVANLEGIPFALPSADSIGNAQSVLHTDVLRFNVGYRGSVSVCHQCEDERPLSFPIDPAALRSPEWRAFSLAALGSAAFPVVFASRTITRPKADYGTMKVVLPAGKGRAAKAETITPDLPRDPKDVTFTAADGGIVDNSPVDLARAILNDRKALASNESTGGNADRAVLMIDPMLGSATSQQKKTPAVFAFLSNLGPLIGALIDQARFRPAEVALAQNKDVFSRFLIGPTHEDDQNPSGKHLASASCFGFGGYLAREFREHDFFLGRRDAQAYLADHLTLPPDNQLFAEWKNSTHHDEWVARYANAKGELPIIPLIGPLHPKEGKLDWPDWPKGEADLEALAGSMDRRLDLLHKKLQDAWRPPSLAWKLLKWLLALLWPLVRHAARTALVARISLLLQAHDLA
jgi:Patatin-like phospholipase